MLVKQDICTQQTQTNKPLLIIPMISNATTIVTIVSLNCLHIISRI